VPETVYTVNSKIRMDVQPMYAEGTVAQCTDAITWTETPV